MIPLRRKKCMTDKTKLAEPPMNLQGSAEGVSVFSTVLKFYPLPPFSKIFFSHTSFFNKHIKMQD